MADFSWHVQPRVPAARCVCAAPGGDPDFAATEPIALAVGGRDRNVAMILFPGLGLSSYAIDDLLLKDALLDEVEEVLARIVVASHGLYPVLVV